ncbi:MAG: HAMP domain-containing sensor histidine kinase [Pseudomonadota bacterium]
MIKQIGHNIRHGSFRVKLLFWTVLVQIVLLGMFSVTLYRQVIKKTEIAIEDNMELTINQYQDASRFALISSAESDRLGFLEGVTATADVEAAFLLTADGTKVASIGDFSEWNFEGIGEGRGVRTRIVFENDDVWIFVAPVYSVDSDDAESAEMLGFLGVKATKRLIKVLVRDLWGTILLLGGVVTIALLFLNSLISQVYLQPVSNLVRDIASLRGSDRSGRLEPVGSDEIDKVAIAVNQLMDEVGRKRASLEQEIEAKTIEEKAAREVAEEARRLAERALEWRGALMQVNSHELLTPVRILINELDEFTRDIGFMEEDPNVPRMERRMGRMRTQVQRIESIVDDLNMSYQLERDTLEPKQEKITTEDIVGPLVEMYTEEARRRKNHIVFDYDPGVELLFDLMIARRVSANLLSNACKFTENGEIRLAVNVNGRGLEIACRDTGVGIDPEKIDLIFEPLRQGDMSSRRVADGMGLGLSIVKGFADRLGGAVEVESVVGVGSEFIVTFPVQYAS